MGESQHARAAKGNRSLRACGPAILDELIDQDLEGWIKHIAAMRRDSKNIYSLTHAIGLQYRCIESSIEHATEEWNLCQERVR